MDQTLINRLLGGFGAGLFSVVACRSASKTTMEPSGLSRYWMRR